MPTYCRICEKVISEEEDSFSIRNFSKPLCKEHQPSEEVRDLGMALVNLGWKVEFKKETTTEDGKLKHIDINLEEAKAVINVVAGLYNDTDKALDDLKKSISSQKERNLEINVPRVLVITEERIKRTAVLINDLLRAR